MTGRSIRFFSGTREVNALLKVHLFDNGEMHPKSTKRESRFSASIVLRNATVKGHRVFIKTRQSDKPECNRDNCFYRLRHSKTVTEAFFILFAK